MNQIHSRSQEQTGTPVDDLAVARVKAKWEGALSEIITRLHYRHEFARRNEGLVTASCELLNKLGIDTSQVPAYLLPGPPVYASRLMIDAVRAADPKILSIRKVQLREFLAKWRVLPMPSGRSKDVYLPRPFSKTKVRRVSTRVRPETLNGVWFALLEFEFFVVGELEMGSTVFLPVLPLNDLRLGGQFITTHKSLDLKKMDLPLLVNPDATEAVVNHYLDVFRIFHDAYFEPHKETQDFQSASWTAFDRALQAYDAYQDARNEHLSIKSAQERAYLHVTGKSAKQDTCLPQVRRWLNAVVKWRAHYRDII